MPVDRGRHRQTVGDIDANPFAFHRFDHRAVHAAVEAPAFGAQAGIEEVVHFLGDEMKDLDAVNHFKRERAAVWHHDRFITLPGKTGGNGFTSIGPPL